MILTLSRCALVLLLAASFVTHAQPGGKVARLAVVLFDAPATNPNATAVSRNCPNGCSMIVRIAPSRPLACCASNVTAA